MTGHEAERPTVRDLTTALERDDPHAVMDLTERILRHRPGDDTAHEFRARALLELGRPEEAERHAAEAVRLDPEEIRYRELLAQALSAVGAHRDAAGEYGRLASNDPHQTTWTVAEAEERLGAAQPRMGVDAARRAVRLAPNNGRAQLALSHALARTGDARGAFQAATLAAELLPNDPEAREALADAHWLAEQDAAAFAEYRSLARELTGAHADRVTRKARTLYRQHAGPFGRFVAAIGPLFRLAFDRGWLSVER